MSKCSSNITKETTPLKLKKVHKLIEYEDIDLIYSISSLIEDTIKRNGIKKKISKKSLFFCEDRKIPDISIYNYIYFIFCYLDLDISIIILSLISINRFLERSKDYLSKNNFYKLFIASCFLNSKQNEDCSYNYEFFASAGKINKNELIILEKGFITTIDYKLFVNDEIYKRYYNFIKSRVVKLNKNIDGSGV